MPCDTLSGGFQDIFNKGGSHHSLTVSYLIEILIEGVATPTTLLEPVPSCYVYDRDHLVSGHQGTWFICSEHYFFLTGNNSIFIEDINI